MKRSFTRFLSVLLAMVMCLSFSVVAFAAETEGEMATESVKESSGNEEDVIMPRGSISGYAQGTITSKNNTLVVWCESSAILTSGMGITVKATGANFTGQVNVKGYAKQGTAASFGPLQLSMGNEIQIQNLTHRGCSAYIIEFSGLNNAQSFVAQVWIYG